MPPSEVSNETLGRESPSESMVVDVTVQRNKISFQIPGERLVRGRGYWDR